MIYGRRTHSVGHDPLSSKLKHKPSRYFTNCTLNFQELSIDVTSHKPNDTQLQKALSNLDTIAHIDLHTYASLLNACATSNALLQGRYLHRHIMAHGNGAHSSLGFLILEMYGKCGSFQDAAAWFQEMPLPDAASWNYMMGLCMQHGRSTEAFHLFDQMLQEGMIPDMVTCISFLSVCTSLILLVEGKRMHARISSTTFQVHIVVTTALVNLYSKCGDTNHALQLFDGMPQRGTITWNALISGYKQNKQCKEVLQLFDQMHIESMLPSRETFACVLSACATEVLAFQGKRMHVYLKQAGFELDFVVSNALIRMYSQTCSLQEAKGLFNVLSTRSTVAAKAMVAAYIHHGSLKDAIKLLIKMQDEGTLIEMASFIRLLEMCGDRGAKALAEGKQVHSLIKRSGQERNTIIGNSLISMYGRCHSLGDARQVFEEMPDRDVVSWNAIIAAYAQNKHAKEGTKALHQMQQVGMLPNEVTFICVIDSYDSQADILDTPWFQLLLRHSGFCSETAVATALANAHAKSGSLASACNIFDIIREPNVISWTTMILSHSMHGFDIKAMQLFKQMLQQGALPDTVMFVTTINATTSIGSVKEGKIMHTCIKLCQPETEVLATNALINMYGKCGYMGAALDVFIGVSVRNLETWNIMIGVYAQHGCVTEASTLLHNFLQAGLAPDKVTSLTCLSACSRAGLVEEALSYMLTMHTENCDKNCDDRPTLEHYDCIVDVLGRANQLHRVQFVIEALPLQPSGLSWMTLFTVCRDLLDTRQREFIAKHVLELDPFLLGFL